MEVFHANVSNITVLEIFTFHFRMEAGGRMRVAFGTSYSAEINFKELNGLHLNRLGRSSRQTYRSTVVEMYALAN
jgi:hypothetical protein